KLLPVDDYPRQLEDLDYHIAPECSQQVKKLCNDNGIDTRSMIFLDSQDIVKHLQELETLYPGAPGFNSSLDFCIQTHTFGNDPIPDHIAKLGHKFIELTPEFLSVLNVDELFLTTNPLDKLLKNRRLNVLHI